MRVFWPMVVLLLALPGLMAEEIQEKDESGKIKGKFTVVNGSKQGPFIRYYDNGKVCGANGTYKSDQLDGPYYLFYPDGKTLSRTEYKEGKLVGAAVDYSRSGAIAASAAYKNGQLEVLRVFDGQSMISQLFKNDLPRCPRRYAEIQEALSVIDLSPRPKAAKDDRFAVERAAALRRLQAYRSFVGVPYDGLQLDGAMNRSADAGAEICQAIGRIDHNPPNPNWPDAKYKFALTATRSSNLAASSGSMPLDKSVDLYMDDSNASNIDRVGHRRWCLNPSMLKVGFGKSPDGKFADMMAHDRSRKDVPAYNFVAYPPAGLVPPGLFGANYAWSVSPNPEKFKPPVKDRITISVFDKSETGKPLKLSYSNVDLGGFGSGPAVIFRPEKLNMSAGARYFVKIDGLESKDGRKSSIEYLVWFTEQ